MASKVSKAHELDDMTNADLESRLREAGHDARSAKAHTDAVAAQLILQIHFDSLTAHAHHESS